MTGAEAAQAGRANLTKCRHLSFDNENSLASKREDMPAGILRCVKFLWRASSENECFFIFVHKKLY